MARERRERTRKERVVRLAGFTCRVNRAIRRSVSSFASFACFAGSIAGFRLRVEWACCGRKAATVGDFGPETTEPRATLPSALSAGACGVTHPRTPVVPRRGGIPSITRRPRSRARRERIGGVIPWVQSRLAVAEHSAASMRLRWSLKSAPVSPGAGHR